MDTVSGEARVYIGNHTGDNNKHIYHTAYWNHPNGPDIKTKVLNGLFLTNSTDDRSALIMDKGPRVEGTCEWLTRVPTYIAWKDSPKSQLLWISGGPGKGKTMLSIYLTQEEEVSTKSVDAAFLYFFCASRNQKRNSANAILRSFLYQLLCQMPQLSKYVLDDLCSSKNIAITTSSLEALWRIFLSMLQDTGLTSVTCLIDGLDECETGLEPFLKILYGHFSSAEDESSDGKFKLLVASRDKPACIESWLCTFDRIRLDPDSSTEVESDIDRYISSKFCELAIENRLSSTYLETVAQFLRSRANGTFLWVGFVVNELKGKNEIEVENILRNVPSGLDEIYQRMTQQVKQERKDIVTLILQWVSVAQRPLTIYELAEAIKTSQHEAKDLLELCGQLFLPLREDEKVKFVHQSVQDYLQQNELYNAHGHLMVARICFDYIQRPFSINSNTTIKLVGYGKKRRLDLPIEFEKYHLLEYAAIYWPLHSKYASDINIIFDLSDPFFVEQSRIRDNWLRFYWGRTRNQNGPTSFTLMHLAAYLGIVPIAQGLLEQKRTNNQLLQTLRDERDSLGCTPLLWAASKEHETVVKLLLQHGADVDVLSKDHGTALIATSRSGNEAIMKLLLQHGANVDIQTESYGTALAAASEGGHEATVKLLLQHGANVDVLSKGYGTALTAASRYGHEAIVKLLLQHGADVDGPSKGYVTALARASECGNEAIVKLLIQHGADVNIKFGGTATALAVASGCGNEAIVKLLIQHGADVNDQSEDYGTALISASEGGHEAIVKLLLQYGADVNIQPEYYGTALAAASEGGHEAIVKLLLQHGADVNIQSEHCGTALAAASEGGHEATVKLLLQHGANVDVRVGSDSTTLAIASKDGNEAIVKLLLQYGADVNFKTEKGNTALASASRSGYEDIIKLLLKNGALM